MALTAPAANNVSPLTEVDNTANPAALTRVGPRGADGLPTGSDQIDSLITRAYDLAAARPFRRQIIFADLVTARPTRQSHNGAVVSLNMVTDLDDDPTTALLVEDYDVVPTPLKSFRSDLILKEYGRVVTTTALARGTTMIPLDPIAAERVGRNMGATLERLAFNSALVAGGINNDGTAGSTPAVVTVTGSPSDTLRAASQYFRDRSIEPYDDGLYRAVLAPSAETALRKEADAAGWRYWQINQDPGGGTGSIEYGFVGVYEGFRIYTSPLIPGATGGIFLAKDGLAMAHSTAPGFGPMPGVVVSPVVDRLRRFASVGWYFLGGFGRWKAEAVVLGNPAG
jgi:hypothetical protein